MKKITQFNEYSTDKNRGSKTVLLIIAICFAFSVNAQYRLVETLSPLVKSFYVHNNKLYFQSHYGGGNYRILVTDGTFDGAIVLTEGSTSGSEIFNNYGTVGYNVFNSELYFDGRLGPFGQPIHIFKVSNTNISVAQSVYNVSANIYSRFIDSVVLNDRIVFTPLALQGPLGVEPYVIDLTNSANNGVLFDVMNGSGSSNPRYFTVLNGNIFFAAGDGVDGRELWKTDGTSGGTVLFQDINSGSDDSNPDQFNLLGTQLTFVATHASLGRELFKTNGNTGSLVLIKNINAAGDSNPTNTTEVAGTLYFSADNGSVGQELWKSNGISSGTVLIKDINLSGDSNASKFFQFGTDVFFTADDGINGVELWKTDGTNAGTVLIKNINVSGSSNPRNLIEYNGKLYFTANDGVNGEELWATDGTDAGTVMLEFNTIGSGAFTQLVLYNDEIYFGADSGDGWGVRLYAYQDPTLSVDDLDITENQISLFPNPSNNYFQIESNSTLDKVEIYSIQGQSIKSFTPQNQYDISELSSGVYFVKIQTNTNEITKRIIKQ